MATVSIIVPCHNGAAYLREALESAFTQRRVELQVIVVDDGSTDESAAIVTREFPRAELYRTTNLGASSARNCGLTHARGEWVQFLDADDVLAPDKLARQMTAAMDANVQVVYGDWQHLVADASGKFVTGRMVTMELRGTPELTIFTEFWCPPAALLFQHELVRATGEFNKNLPIVQDVRFLLDCAMRGATFAHTSGVACWYRRHPGQISGSRIGLVRDQLANAIEVETIWRERNRLDAAHREALVTVYGNVARTSYGSDPETFARAYQRLLQIEPQYIPTAPRYLALASRFVGYPRAEEVARRYRQLKRTVLTTLGRPMPETALDDAVMR